MLKILFNCALSLLLIFLGAVILCQSSWGKKKIQEAVIETLKKEKLFFSAGSIEGDPPFKWTLRNVRLQLNETDYITLDLVRLRLGILPLLHKELRITYCKVDHAEFFFTPQERINGLPDLSLLDSSWTFYLKYADIESITVHNQLSHLSESYAFQGSAKIKSHRRLFSLEGSLRSENLFAKAALEFVPKRGNLYLKLDATLDSEKAASPFIQIPFATKGSGSLKLEGSLSSALKGSLSLQIKELGLDPFKGLNPESHIESSFTLFSDKSFEVESALVKSELFCLKGSGKFTSFFEPQEAKFSILLPHLSHITPLMSGIALFEGDYTSSNLQLKLSSEEMALGELHYKNVEGRLEASSHEELWKGSLSLEAPHTLLPLQIQGVFEAPNFSTLKITDLSVKAPETNVGAVLTLSKKGPSGTALFQAADLSIFNPLLSEAHVGGSMGGVITFKENETDFYALLQNGNYNDLLCQKVEIKGKKSDLFNPLEGQLTIEGSSLYFSQVLLEKLSFSLWNEKENTLFFLESGGMWKEPFSLKTLGSITGTLEQWNFKIDTLQGSLLQDPFYLEKPFSFHIGPKNFLLEDLDLKIAKGSFKASFALEELASHIYLKSDNFPLGLLALSNPQFSLDGGANIDISLEGTPENLSGYAHILLNETGIFQAGKKNPLQSKGSFQIHFNQGVAQIHSHLMASSNQYLELSATLPLTYQLYPFKLGLQTQKPVSAELTIDGHLEEIFDFINIGSQRIEGLISAKLLLSKSLQEPHLQGEIALQNGLYENYITGLYLQEIQIDAGAKEDKIQVSTVTATDGKGGLLRGEGTVALSTEIPFAFHTHINSLKVLQLDWLSASCTGDVTLKGDRHAFFAKGDVILTRADIRIPDSLPLDVPVLPITYIHKPPHLKHTSFEAYPSYVFNYDVRLKAKEGIFLTGRGLSAELEGEVHVKGKNMKVEMEGSLFAKKGKFSFSGKDFNLTQGTITFVNEPSESAFLNVSALLALPDVTVTANLKGPLTTPALTFQSTPQLPTSSILARILFNKDISELSAPQALQLADTIVNLSGSSGPGVLDSIRKGLGVDRLNIVSSSGDTDRIGIQIGKYLTKGVMVTLSQSAESSDIIVEVELKAGFVFQAETQADQQGKFSLKWNKNY